MATPAETIEISHGAPSGTAVLALLRSRRSMPRVRPERPPRELIEQVIDAAVWAPNHHLTQPWRFVVLTGEARRELGEAMARGKVAREREVDPAKLDALRRKPLRAPVIVAVGVIPASRKPEVEIEEICAGAAAIQNLLLAAHGLGLAAIWRTGEAAFDPEVKAFLGLPPDAHLLGFVYLGYPDGEPPQRPRRPAAEVTRWLGWE
ncbi:nitroreductase [Thermomicrobiaceae bacterium CFH 74404]|uniref:Putative NAD(P)H nitroreductase n=1 Tax=Thermalbibacter longus TaxID=2951981 RepID=A0AA41WHR1_9BACT|nr:nitroreductase [Thermalbibacter longus]MCM8750685.1 nitroreductase [Thermalbibacter longus]